MKNRLFRLAILAIALVFGMAVVGCGGGDGSVPIIPLPQTVSYQSADTAGYTYILVITVNGYTAAAGDSYVLTIKTGTADKISKGTVSANNNGALILQPNKSGSDTFSVTINNEQMTAINGTIAIEGNGESVSAPGTVTPQGNSGDGVTIDGWTWGKPWTDSPAGGISTITRTRGSGNDSNKITLSGNVQKIPGLTYGYAGCHIEPNSANLASLKSADSFFFKCRGDEKQYVVYVSLSDVSADNKYRKIFTASTTDNTITVQYSELAQGWGNTIPFNKNNIIGIQFEALVPNTGEGPFNITIWDLKAGGQEPGGNNNSGTSQWTAVTNSTFSTSQIINAIAYGNNTFVAVGGVRDGGSSVNMATSTDGRTWTAVSDNPFGRSIYTIAYGNNTFFVSGGDISDDLNSRKTATSTDGRTWTAVSNSTLNSTLGRYYTISVIAYGNGKFVASNGATTRTSTNGTTWTAVSDSIFGTDDHIQAIAYGNGTFVVGTYKGKTATSTDGTTWTAVSDSTISCITAIACGNGKFIAVGDMGKIAISTNGTTWTTIDVKSVFSPGDYYIEAIAYGNGKFVAGNADGKTAISTDGVTWTATNRIFGSGVNRSISVIAYGNNTFVAGSYEGRIAYLSDN
jgi:hypothetical protein